MSKEKQIRKIIREEIQGVIQEDNVLSKFLVNILNNLGSAAKKRAVKKLLSTPEIQDLMNADTPERDKYNSSWEKLAKKYS
tara:strand:+ start:4318 stop:4560 length:243 start_codon:yes stop_codon:yes gene_type:complete